ncbi:MAG: hypothetical protein ACE141_07325 [Bryobacteraceae bacterium]
MMLGARWWCLFLYFNALAAGAPTYGIVFTQAPSSAEGARVVLLGTDGRLRVLTEGFHSAADPEISFDGRRVLFAAKKAARDNWDIYEMEISGAVPRQITRSMGNCRSPMYQSAIFYLNDPRPSYQITFVSDLAGELEAGGAGRRTDLYSVMPDGTGLRRLTYDFASNFDPRMAWDGRILFAAGARLFGIHLDGTDFALVAESRGRAQRMPAATPAGLVVFVETVRSSWDAGGPLASVTLRRPMRSYRQITLPEAGEFHSPSPLPDGSVLVARRRAGEKYGIFRVDPEAGRVEAVHADPRWNEMQPRAVTPRAEPDGHSSVVDEQDATGKLYCLNVYDSDLGPEWLPKGNVPRLRVLEGVPRKGAGEVEWKRFLGEVNTEDDGSFQIQVPANTPIQLQLVDKDGVALRSCSWIWTKNKENRGCIGCHEDPERTPENVLAKAVVKPAIRLTLPPESRRTVTYQRDVAPLMKRRCETSACHPDGFAQKYVDPGRARTSPLVWSILGRDTSREGDPAPKATVKPMPPAGSASLTGDEKRTIIEWIDLGATAGRAPGGKP